MKRAIATCVVAGLVMAAWAQNTDEAAQDKPGAADAKAGGGTDSHDGEASGGAAMTAEKASGPLDFTMKRIDGQDAPLSKYKGKVVLLVNVASECGLTPQYEQLQGLHKKYAEKGLAVLGFPANEFGSQEPGSNAEIKQFCTQRFGVEFDLFEKVVVKGAGACELYKWLTSKKNGDFAGEIRWNFTKFLVDRQGKVLKRFEPRTRPDAPEVVEAIEKALAEQG